MITRNSLLPYEHPSLFNKCRPVPRNMVKRITEELESVWHNVSCAGMAAPQFGRPYVAFVAQGKIFINVDEVELLGTPTLRYEGCFSCSGLHTIRRYPEVKVRIGKEVTHYTGYIAQVIQHEYDHTQGVLIKYKERKA